MKTELSLIEEGIQRRGAYQVASSLLSQRGDEAEKVVYLSGIREAVKARLLTALRVRRIHLYNLRGF